MAAFLTSVSSVVVIVLMMALGYILRKNGWFDDSFSSNISKLITQIALPASIFISVQDHLTRDGLGSLFQGLLFPALGVVIGYIIAWLTVKAFKIRPGRRGIFMNTVVNANTIFIGMPLNNALFGSKGLSYFLIYYIINTVSTWAFGVYLIYNDDPVSKNKNAAKKINWRKLLPMPLVGFIVAILWLLTGIKVPAFAAQTLTYVGGLVTPLSLIYIGIVLCDAGLKNFKIERDTILGLIGRFILSPVVLILLIKFVAPAVGIHMASLMRETFIVQAATPALAVLPILANEAHGDVKYATDIVVMSTVLFIVVVPILMTIIQYI